METEAADRKIPPYPVNPVYFFWVFFAFFAFLAAWRELGFAFYPVRSPPSPSRHPVGAPPHGERNLVKILLASFDIPLLPLRGMKVTVKYHIPLRGMKLVEGISQAQGDIKL